MFKFLETFQQDLAFFSWITNERKSAILSLHTFSNLIFTCPGIWPCSVDSNLISSPYGYLAPFRPPQQGRWIFPSFFHPIVDINTFETCDPVSSFTSRTTASNVVLWAFSHLPSGKSHFTPQTSPSVWFDARRRRSIYGVGTPELVSAASTFAPPRENIRAPTMNSVISGSETLVILWWSDTKSAET